MEETRYGIHVAVPLSYEVAVDRTTQALKAEGFGVLTTIDVKQTLKQKLDREFRKYVILYRPLDDGIEVIRVVHGSRDIAGLFA